jgi:acetyl esterase/lipase
MDDRLMRLKYLQMVAEKVPEYQSDFNRQTGDRNPVFVHVVKAYAEALRAAGNPAEAARWEGRIASGKAK